MIDQNRDGFIDKDDLIEMLTSLGKNPEDQLLDHMINEVMSDYMPFCDVTLEENAPV